MTGVRKGGVSSAYLALAVTAVIVVASALYIALNTGVKGFTTLANPGGMTAAQISRYPICSKQQYTYNTTFNCSVGYVIQGNGTLILGSINANNTVTTYAYDIGPAVDPAENIPSTVETYKIGDVVGNMCRYKLTVLGVSYLQQHVTIGVSPGNGLCPI
jgi:hypothetical protein